MTQALVRDYKDAPLEGGTLLVSLPQFGVGSILLTDHVLEAYAMDGYAGVDCDDFPPLAMIRKGRARFPMRIHADPATRLAVLRSELHVPPRVARPIALALLAWVKRHGIARVIVLDHVASADGPAGAQPGIYAIPTTEATRRLVREARVEELDEAVVGGILSMLLLEARFAQVDLVGLVAELRSAMDEPRSLLAFANLLPRLVPGLHLDAKRLEQESERVAETVRAMQAEIERTLRAMEPKASPEEPPIYV